MRIATWNVNSIRIRLNNIKEFVDLYNPDVIAFQETKVRNEEFPAMDIMSMGYKYLRNNGEKSYNGVAIVSKFPILNSFEIEIYNNDKRHVAVKIKDIEIHNFYVPAGGDIPDITVNKKFKHKLEYLEIMNNWFLSNRSQKDKMILVGDLNIAPYEHDVWSSKQLKDVISHTPVERELLLRNMNSMNWIDAPREHTPLEEKLYSWWSYRGLNWQTANRGRRLDHIWISEPLKKNLKSSHIFTEARGKNHPSDHVPVIIDLEL